MKPKPQRRPNTDALLAELLRLGPARPGLRACLENAALDESEMIALLRRPVGVPFLELVAASAPWCARPRVLGGVVLNPVTPRVLAQRLLPSLYWRDLADVAASPRLDAGVRAKAEGQLKDKLSDLRLGEKITLARLATPLLLRLMLLETDPRILSAGLENPRLRESDLAAFLQGLDVTRALLEATGGSSRWKGSYAVRLALVLQPKTPLPVALAQLTSLVARDLKRLVETPGLAPLLQAAAARVAREAQEG